MATVYFLYDGELKYSTDNALWAKVEESTTTGDNSGEAITWQVSDQDKQLTKIKIKTKNKKDQTLPKGKWKDTWEVKPYNVSDKECTGTPLDPDATKEDPSFFAYDIQYNVQDGPTETIDPSIQIPEDQ